MTHIPRGSRPLVSIVTPSYNKGRYIEKTIQSILEQDYPNIEHIVLDSCSMDETPKILEKHRADPRLKIIVEPDKGQWDAINKGFSLARGEILGFINADDLYVPGAIATVVRYFQEHPDWLLLYGNGKRLDPEGNEVGWHDYVRPFDRELLRRVDYILQPSAFWRRSLWKRVGPMSLKYNCVGDWEWFVRASEVAPFHYVPDCLSTTYILSDSKTSLGGWRRHREIADILRRYGGCLQVEYIRFQLLAWHGQTMERVPHWPGWAHRWAYRLTRLPYRVFARFFHHRFYW